MNTFTRITSTQYFLGSLVVAGCLLSACSSSDSSNGTNGTGGANSATGGSNGPSAGGSNASGGTTSSNVGGGGPVANTIVGTFDLTLNPAIDALGPFTSVAGKVFSGPVLTEAIATPIAQNADCKVYKFSTASCTNPACTASQTCVATEQCQDNPTLVSVGEATISGVNGGTLKLAATNKNYQNVVEITYPGFNEGDTLTLSVTGDYYTAFSIPVSGVAPMALSADKYTLVPGSGLDIKWTPGSSSVSSSVDVGLNISKHGGSAGYLECNVADTGSLTIPADLITALIGLGVSGFPQLTVTRVNSGEATVPSGKVQFRVNGLANPNLQIQGYCSCTGNGDCGDCSDSTKTTCNTVKKLCYAP